jgi:16S rRNA (cytosine1402-N4)-methyltransferase
VIMAPTHVPVMPEEVFQLLSLKPGAAYVDATLGLGGHASMAAEMVSPGGKVIGLDWDADLLATARQRLLDSEDLSGLDVAFSFHRCDYREMKDALNLEGGPEGPLYVNGILADLGVNNHHLEAAERGFSLKSEGPLDMRMDRSKGETAAAFLNRATATQIENVLFELGDERWARRIAQVILEKRPLKTTTDLIDCVLAAVPAAKRDKGIHPARRTFQAVRIHVNGELESLEQAVLDMASCLAPGGVMVVLSYHSGEDRAVKAAFRRLSQTGQGEDLTRKPLVPSEAEVARNPKSRSAKLRAYRQGEGRTTP